ncbi:MAG TPA: hypothetical protein VNY27_09515 [Solirubrobacteraceae bacterium]|jgi:hypothetical protein|nr:hypothetical protein [Solirubrobacteraceae bacterium]
MTRLNTTPLRAAREHCSTPRPVRRAIPRRIAVDLTPQAIEQVADRIAQLLAYQQQQQAKEAERLISAGELALHLGVARPWIYKHRHLLGGQRIGEGPKAPWRFDPHTAMQALQRHQATLRAREEP